MNDIDYMLGTQQRNVYELTSALVVAGGDLADLMDLPLREALVTLARNNIRLTAAYAPIHLQ